MLKTPNFDKKILGTTLPQNGWTIRDQSTTATSSVGFYPVGRERKCGRVTTSPAFWASAVMPGTFGDIDYRIRIAGSNTNFTYVTVRNQNIAGFFDNCYSLRLRSDQAQVDFVKQCGGNVYIRATYAKTFSMSDVRVRIVMQGLVMHAWVNDDYIGNFDFTGDVLCSSVAFNTGGYGLVALNKTYYFMPDYPQPIIGVIK